MKKGFTLIELLAVIVILAIIALIATPIILNIISDTREEANERSVELYASAIMNAVAKYQLNNNGNISGTFTSSMDGKLLTKKGEEKPKLTIDYNGKVYCKSIKIYENGSVFLAGCNGDIMYNKQTLSIPLKGLTPVKYNGTSWVVTTQSDKDWYNYDKQEWANAVILNDGVTKNVGDTLTVPTSSSTTSDVKAMFVWIPRYEYKIEGAYGKGGTSKISPGEIEVDFIPKEQTIASKGYIIHPAFTFGTEELDGIWVGKFETSVDVTSACYNTGDYDDCDNVNQNPYILPNVKSLIHQNLSNQFVTSQKFNSGSVTADAHMMKNSEWGAVAYLSQSKYGKYGNSNYIGANKEIFQNKSPITGNSSITGNSNGTPSQSTTNTQCTYDDTNNTYGKGPCGVGASTTGNITGIYDMSGGAWEYVMGNYNNIIGASKFSDMPNIKYYDLYTTTEITTACNGGICYGQALSETSGWYSDIVTFVGNNDTWLLRGGPYNRDSSAGVFSLHIYIPESGYNYSSRIVLS